MTHTPTIQPPKLQYNSSIAIHFTLPATMSQYNNCIMTQCSSPTASPNCTLLSRYNGCIVTLIPRLLYANFQFCCIFFFHFFILFIYLFHLFPAIGKCPKNIYTYFFFSFSRTPNKFIKIYFHSFSLVLHTTKTLENDFLHLLLFFFISISNLPCYFLHAVA